MARTIDYSERIVQDKLAQVGQAFHVRVKSGQRQLFAVFQCDCGERVVLRRGNVLSGGHKSCGCWREEVNRTKSTTHGHTAGGKDSPTFSSWRSMWGRVNTKNESIRDRYAGRGIQVCERWESFEAFLKDMGERPPLTSLDRVDNMKGYEPSNCRWATRQQQQRNMRSNVRVTIDGLTMCLAEWCDMIGIGETTAGYRLKSGWTPFEAVFTPAGMSRDTLSRE